MLGKIPSVMIILDVLEILETTCAELFNVLGFRKTNNKLRSFIYVQNSPLLGGGGVPG
jgi:hypothetical protein